MPQPNGRFAFVFPSSLQHLQNARPRATHPNFLPDTPNAIPTPTIHPEPTTSTTKPKPKPQPYRFPHALPLCTLTSSAAANSLLQTPTTSDPQPTTSLADLPTPRCHTTAASSTTPPQTATHSSIASSQAVSRRSSASSCTKRISSATSTGTTTTAGESCASRASWLRSGVSVLRRGARRLRDVRRACCA